MLAAKINLLNPPDNIIDIEFQIPVYENGSTFPVIFRVPEPCLETGTSYRPEEDSYIPKIGDGPCFKTVLAYRRGPRVSIGDVLVCNLRFEISEWRSSVVVPGEPHALTITIGSVVKQAVRGESAIEFVDIPKGSHNFTVYVEGGLTSGTTPLSVKAPGILPVIIE
jgi:hypothetical protein